MRAQDLTYFAQEPWTLVLVLPIIGFVLWFGLYCLGWLGFKISHRRRIALYSVVLLLTQFVPARALAAGLRYFLVVPVAVLTLFVVRATPWGRKTLALPKMQRVLQSTVEAGLEATVEPPPRGLRRWSEEFERLGFAPIANIREPGGSTGCVLFQPEEGIVARLYQLPLPMRGLPRQTATLFSVASERRGILSSSNAGLLVDAWANEIAEILPGADSHALVDSHLRARTLLKKDGVRFEVPSASNVLDVASWAAREEAKSLLRLPDESLIDAANTIVHSPRELASMHQDAAMAERIAALRG